MPHESAQGDQDGAGVDGGSPDAARGAGLRDVSPSKVMHLLWIVPLALAVGAASLIGAWYFQKILEHYDLMFWRHG